MKIRTTILRFGTAGEEESYFEFTLTKHMPIIKEEAEDFNCTVLIDGTPCTIKERFEEIQDIQNKLVS